MKNKLLWYFMIATCILCTIFSCASPKALDDSEQVKEVTINTNLTDTNKVFAIRQYESITQIVIKETGNSATNVVLDADEYQYDKATTMITITPKAHTLPPEAWAISIKGVPQEPATFLLVDYDKDYPLLKVFVAKKELKLGEKATFDEANLTLTFNEELDLEKEHYLLVWQTGAGLHTLGEYPEEDEAQYAEIFKRTVDELLQKALLK